MQKTKKQLIVGVLYTAISKYSGMAISLVVAGILARMLPTDDFGIVAIATVIISFFSILSDLGIAPAIIQNKELTQYDTNGLFTVTLFSGILTSLIFFGLSWTISSFYDSAVLLYICQWLSINMFFATINIVPNALLYKDKRFKFIAMRALAVHIISGSVAVFGAYQGLGIYALLINPILSSIVLFLITIYQYPQKLVLKGSIASTKKIFSYSAYQFLFNIINYFSRNLDKLIIGKYMGMVNLGYYEKSYRLMMLPLQNISHVISPVMHPIFAELQNDMKRLSDSYIKVIRFLGFIGFPLSALLFFCAKEITLIIFGAKWEPSIPVFQILSLSVGIQIILSTSGSIFQSANSTKILFISGVLSTILNITGICIGIFVYNSLEAIAWGIVITFTLNFIQCYILLYKVTLKQKLFPMIKNLMSPITCTIICAILLYFTNRYTLNLPLLVSILIKSAVFGVTILTYLQVSKEYDIIGKLRSLKK